MQLSSSLTAPSITKNSGFTLLEIMVVVGLIGLMSVSIMLTVPSGKNGNQYLAQKQQLAAILRSLSQRAILEQRWYGLRFKDRSYQAVFFSNKKWVVKPDTSPKEIADDLAFELLVDNQLVSTQSKPSNSDQVALITDSALLGSKQPKQESYLPQIMISPTGLFNQFELRFGDEQLEDNVLSDPYAKI